MATVLQLSDIHLHRRPDRIVGGVDPRARLDTVVRAVVARLAEGSGGAGSLPADRSPAASEAGTDAPEPALVLLTGDLAEDGSPAAYAALDEALAPLGAWPRLALPGNHDDPGVLAAALGEPSVHRLDRWTVVGADTTIPGEIDGELGPARLDALLVGIDGAATEHVLVALHHPPAPGCDCDWFRLRDAAVLLPELAARRRVRAVVSGHLHHAFDRSGPGGLRLLGAPATLNAYRHGPPTHEPDPDGPTGARLLHLHDDGTIGTELVVA